MVNEVSSNNMDCIWSRYLGNDIVGMTFWNRKISPLSKSEKSKLHILITFFSECFSSKASMSSRHEFCQVIRRYVWYISYYPYEMLAYIWPVKFLFNVLLLQMLISFIAWYCRRWRSIWCSILYSFWDDGCAMVGYACFLHGF